MVVPCQLLVLIAVLVGGTLRESGVVGQEGANWKLHPALREPDGRSHRRGNMVAAGITDPRVLKELSRRFREAKPIRTFIRNGKRCIEGEEDYEKRQEYLLRLLDYYWFSKPRLIGMKRAEVEQIFGPLEPLSPNDNEKQRAERGVVSGGRDDLCLYFTDGRLTGVYYAPGY